MAKELSSLTSLRAVAAGLVFLTHTQILAAGTIGVTFFFVLLGFVLTWGHRSDAGRANFYLRRFARVYPLHIAVWAAMVFVPALAIADN